MSHATDQWHDGNYQEVDMALLCQRLTGPGYLVVVHASIHYLPQRMLDHLLVGDIRSSVKRLDCHTGAEIADGIRNTVSLHYHVSILQTAELRAS